MVFFLGIFIFFMFPSPISATLIVFSLVESIASFRNIKKIKAILKSKTPKSLREYLLIFPDACLRCGSRDWIKVIWKLNEQEDRNFLDQAKYLKTYCKCVYCGYINNSSVNDVDAIFKQGSWYTEVNKYNYRVSSPYLSKAQEKSIPDWN